MCRMTKPIMAAVAVLLLVAVCATGGDSARKTAPPDQAIREMVLINGGTFTMGSASGRDDEKPAHTVTITSFYMGKYVVTQKEWTAVMGNNPSEFKGDNLPMENVSWYDAIEYCNRLSEREGLTLAYTIDKNQKDMNNTNEYDERKWTVRWNRNANGYRLPTEAEWEYAARGGNGSPGNYIYSGSNNVDEVAWYGVNSSENTQDVGTKKPNELGLYDMSGNVLEWCWDWKGTYQSEAQTDPVGAPSGSYRVLRGGFWIYSAEHVRSASRNDGYPFSRFSFIGFRLVRNAN